MTGSIPAAAEPLDISDDAMADFLALPFQYDYTAITNDTSLRTFIDALDYHLAMVEYRQRKEYVADPATWEAETPFSEDLERRYRELLSDAMIFKLLTDWQGKSEDPVNRAFIRVYMARRNAFTSDASAVRPAQQLSERIANRLYTFSLEVDGTRYGVNDAANVMFGDGDIELARKLHRQLNDSVAVLAADAGKLYKMYQTMGQYRGHMTSIDFHLAQLSFRKPEWLIIAQELESVTEVEYQACLKKLKADAGLDSLPLFEIERRIGMEASLPDEYFTADKIETAIRELFVSFGFDHIHDLITVDKIDSAGIGALGVRLYPPNDNLLFIGSGYGFDTYIRQVIETARVLPWIYADTALPYVLRDYPLGSEEMLTGIFESLALRKDFLAAQFDIPEAELGQYETFRRWQEVFRVRQILMYFYFDYYLSAGEADDPSKTFIALQDSLFDVRDNSYQWVETLLTGRLESFPERLAWRFTALKTVEMLRARHGNDYANDPRSGSFLKKAFCLPGRTQTIEEYVSNNLKNRLGVSDLQRQLDLR
jgi:hypothetical protein